MRLEDYISEAVSGKRSHSKHYNSRKEITNKTTLTEILRILDECGMTRVHKMDPETRTSVDRNFTLDAIRTWNFMYDVADMPAGVTILFVITDRRCYKLYWDTRYKNYGPVEATLREMDKANKFTTVTIERAKALDELNKELSAMA